MQQASLQLGEDLPLFSVVTGAFYLVAKGKPLLAPGAQAFGGRSLALSTGVQGFMGVPGFQAGLDIALEDFSQVVVAVKLVFVGNASEGVNGVSKGGGGRGSGCGWQT